MGKIKLINGWTIPKIMEQLKKKNNGSKCIRANGACEYGSADKTNHCFVGAFIPDTPEFEACMTYGKGGMSLVSEFPKLMDHMPLERRALNRFQAIHDCWSEKQGPLHEVARQWLESNVENG